MLCAAINSSLEAVLTAVGFPDRFHDEGSAFLVDVVADWEAACGTLASSGDRGST